MLIGQRVGCRIQAQLAREWTYGSIQATFHGPRYARLSHLAASASPVICSALGSQVSLRPRRRAMLPRWQMVAVRWPISTSATGGLRDLMQARKSAWWLSLA